MKVLHLSLFFFSYASAFLPGFFGGHNYEEPDFFLEEDFDYASALNIENPDVEVNAQLKFDTMTLARDSISVEKEKFSEALVQEMQNKVREYLRIKTGSENEKKSARIFALPAFKSII